VNYTAVGATEAFFSFPCCAAIPIIAVSSFAMKGDEEMARAVRWLARRLIHHPAQLIPPVEIADSCGRCEIP